MTQTPLNLNDMNRVIPRGLNKLGKGIKVIVIDDSLAMRKIISQHLKSEGYDICGEANNGQDGVNLYKELMPELVLLDINMPVMDGITCLQKIIEFNDKANVVMSSSESQKDVVYDAISKGAKDYIVKPPERKQLLDKVAKVLNIT